MIFPKISGLCKELAHARDLLETLGEVYTSNFLTVMYYLKLHIKAGTSKNRYNRISEQSLATQRIDEPKHLILERIASPRNEDSDEYDQGIPQSHTADQPLRQHVEEPQNTVSHTTYGRQYK